MRLGQGAGVLLTEADIDGFLVTVQHRYDEFMAFADTQTQVDARRRQRVLAGQGVTLVHRDPHPRNILYPYGPDRDPVKLIDWQSWRVDTGTDDLAYLMACHWPLDSGSRLEWELVARYHRVLLAHGISGYSWDDCWYHYRASIIRSLFFLLVAWSPTQWSGGVWWERVQRGLAAYERGRCGELMG